MWLLHLGAAPSGTRRGHARVPCLGVCRSRLHGPGRPFTRFARAGLVKAGHIPAQEKLRQLQALGARLYACAGLVQHFNVAKTDLAFGDVTIAEYLAFMETMAHADINVFLQ